MITILVTQFNKQVMAGILFVDRVNGILIMVGLLEQMSLAILCGRN
ncbi:MAG: hypothetical protein IPH11_12940 [Ignavibacteriales bacterium]|nr:hypothetical protein [Ignavibacteriales bacterium]